MTRLKKATVRESANGSLPFSPFCLMLQEQKNDDIVEQNFQNVIYISLLVLGKYVRTEVHSSQGRADCIIETPSFVYIFEFKRDGSAQEALSQISEQGYDKPYSSDARKIFKIGVNFSSEKKNIADWLVE